MEVATPLEASLEGQQLLAMGPQPPQHPALAQPLHQQPGQLPLMVSTTMQPAQQYVSTYTAAAQVRCPLLREGGTTDRGADAPQGSFRSRENWKSPGQSENVFQSWEEEELKIIIHRAESRGTW